MLTKMIGPGGPNDIAICGPDQVAEWRTYGYQTEADIAAAEEAAKAAAEEARLKAEADAKAAEEAAKAGKSAKG